VKVTPEDSRVDWLRGTLSRAQRAHVDSLVLPGVQVRLEGWDSHRPEQPYDRIVSVGAFEHFVAGDIFPDAALPRLSEITAACDPYFAVTSVRAAPEDYARTLGVWSARLLRARQEAEEVAGDEVYRRDRRYLRACEVTFLRGAATLYRIGFRRRDEPLRLSA
jgi:cyclopropane-fatty-acyl-phospholipid synthase